MRPLQAEIIETLGVQPTIDPATEIKRSITLLKDYLKQTGLKTLVLGISGGQDSALAGKLAQFAVEQLREETGDGEYQFIAMRLPYNEQADESDALAAIKWQEADKTVTVNIEESVLGVVHELEAAGVPVSDLFNKMAEKQMKSVPVIIKADVQGSVEALAGSFRKIDVEGVKVDIIHTAVGAINESDVTLAEASGAIIVGFNVRPTPQAKQQADT